MIECCLINSFSKAMQQMKNTFRKNPKDVVWEGLSNYSKKRFYKYFAVLRDVFNQN